jgi:hypothetical protein
LFGGWGGEGGRGMVYQPEGHVDSSGAWSFTVIWQE